VKSATIQYLSITLSEQVKAREMDDNNNNNYKRSSHCVPRGVQIAILLHCLGLRRSTRTWGERIRKDEDDVEGDDGGKAAWTEAISDPNPWYWNQIEKRRIVSWELSWPLSAPIIHISGNNVTYKRFIPFGSGHTRIFQVRYLPFVILHYLLCAWRFQSAWSWPIILYMGQHHFEGNCYLRAHGIREMEAAVSSVTLVSFNRLHGATFHNICISVRKSSITLGYNYNLLVEAY
jgi:hypothetical protein